MERCNGELCDKISKTVKSKLNKDMDSYDTFMEIMNVMIVILVLAAIVLGIVVLL